jgi:hypothetical protein
MKRLSVFLLSIVIVLVLFFAACENKQDIGFSPPQKNIETSQSGLTNEKVEAALKTAFGKDYKPGMFNVVGIIEQQNSARVDVKYNNYSYPSPIGATRTLNGISSATLSRYNNGKWVISSIQLAGTDSFHPNTPIE